MVPSRRRDRLDGLVRTFSLTIAFVLGFLYGRQFVDVFETYQVKDSFEGKVSLPGFVEKSIPVLRPGFQEKAGIVPDIYWAQNAAAKREGFFEDWLFRYIYNGHITQPSFPFPHCQVYINHDYKFIWIKGHKVGSTAMRGPLGWLCDDHWKIPENASFNHCSHGLWHQLVYMTELKHQWMEYFVFGVIRNPFDRFASAYEYIKGMSSVNGCDKESRHVSFSKACKDPYIFSTMCSMTKCWCKEHHFRHFMPQAPCLLTGSLLPAIDFLADVVTMEEDLETILSVINERRNADLPPLQTTAHYGLLNAHNSPEEKGERMLLDEVPEYVQRLYDENPECLEHVGRFFHQDFLLFGYDEHSRSNRTQQ